jgi:uncharacterized OsmC-like protein
VVEKEEGVLVLRRIHVRYILKADPVKREAMQRAHRFHAEVCPVASTICRCVAISTEIELHPI